MTQNLKIFIIQTNLYWEKPEENLKMLEEKIISIEEKADIILLPEMFTTGFSMHTQFSETVGGQATQWLQKMAEKKKCAVCGTVMVYDNGNFYNRFLFADEEKKLIEYNKRHLFSMGDENNYFTRGNKKIIIEHKGWKILPQICYDLRFPVFSRNIENYDLILYTANWPSARIKAWEKLLPARAIENQCYVAAVNRVGEDGNGFSYSGSSCFISPIGDFFNIQSDGKEKIISYEFNYEELHNFRKQFPVLNDADEFEIK